MHPEGSAVKKIKLSSEPLTFERIEYSKSIEYLELPLKVVSYAGLAGPSRDQTSTDKRLLFCRDALHQQMAFLKNLVLEEGHTGFVYGPPGTGKSNTTLAFCLSNETREYVVTWIHLDRQGNEFDCFQTQKNTLVQVENISDGTLGQSFLSSVPGKHLVILDGYADSQMMHVSFKNMCVDWFKKSKESRRLVIISSMSSLVKVSADEEAKLRWKNHVVCSWEFAEYEKAVANNSFFDSVKQYLDADDVSLLQADAAQLTEEQKLSLLPAKYYYAGGSCRFMFSNSTKDVMEKLSIGLSMVGDITPYLNGDVGDRSNQAINRLLGRLPEPGVEFTFRIFIISRYASLLFTQKMGPDKVLAYAESLASLRNPSLMGWIFEMLFFSVLRHRQDGVKLVTAEKVVSLWPNATPKRFDPLSFDFTEEATRNSVWYQPEKWNQGAYDAVFITKVAGGCLVRFVQVASGDTHELKLDIIHAFMHHCKQYFETKTLEIIFLIPKTKLKVFKIGKVTGSGLLSLFSGWTKGKESEQCQILALDEKWEYAF